MTAYKAVVEVFAGEPKKIAENKPNYRSGSNATEPVVNSEEITGKIFAYTVTGKSIEEVTKKAKAMFDANVEGEQ